MINEDIIKLKKELFEGEYSDILKAISSSNTFLAKSTIESYLREFSADNNRRKLNAIELFVAEYSKLHYYDDGSVIKVIDELFKYKTINSIKNITFDTNINNALLYGDFVRFIFALYFGKYQEELNIIIKYIYESISVISHNLVSNFEKDKINIIKSSSVYRNIFDVLALFSEMAGDARSRAEVMHYKSYITANVMQDYRALIGPDMIKTAICFEEIEDNERAINIYKSITSDFECVLSSIVYGNYKEEDRDEDYISLVSLWQAYDGIQRIENTNAYEEKMDIIEKSIHKIIS